MTHPTLTATGHTRCVPAAGENHEEKPGDEVREYYGVLHLAEDVGGPGFDVLAAQLRAAGPPPRSLRGTPLILHMGDAPDETIALICAALEPDLALVITGGSTRAGRYLLDLLHRQTVPVVSDIHGSDPGVLDELIPGTIPIPAQPADPARAFAAACAATGDRIRWASAQSPTTLAHLISEDPRRAGRLVIFQAGGGLAAQDPRDGFAHDPAAVRTVLDSAATLYLLTGDITTSDALALRPGDDLHVHLTTPPTPPKSLLRQHLDHYWSDTAHPHLHLHLRAPITLAAALRKPFITFSRRRPFHLDADARTIPDPDGHRPRVAVQSDCPAFYRWLLKQLTLAPAEPERPDHDT